MRLARTDPARVEQALGVMERQRHQLMRLVDDLSDVSRITLGSWRLRRERFDLGEAIDSAVETSQPLDRHPRAGAL